MTVGPVVSGFTSQSFREWVAHLPIVASVLKEKGRVAAADYTIDFAFPGSAGDATTISRVREIMRDYPFWHYGHANPRRGLQPPAIERLARIQLPTLAVTAERDLQFCQETADHIAKTIAGSQEVVLAEAGHFMMLEKPKEFNRVLVEFLRRQ